MVSVETVHNQLEKLHFNVHGWGRSEANELPHILMPDEEIHDLVNGVYEGGFALLVATNMRILLVDKKPLNYLTVEDLRFDMISEIDYSHRVIGANVSISTGSKNLRFTSLNQQRLRKLTTHVQHWMSELKKKTSTNREDQKGHLEQINQKLEAYLLAQHQQQQQMNKSLNAGGARQVIDVEPINRDYRVADYLYAQNLLNQYPQTRDQADVQALQLAASVTQQPISANQVTLNSQQQTANDLYSEGLKEIFGQSAPGTQAPTQQSGVHAFEIHPLNIAYGKLPHILREKFGRLGGEKVIQEPAAATH